MELYTVDETARLLRVSPITIRRYIAAGQLEAVRVGRGVRVHREAIDRFVKPYRAPILVPSTSS
jgi:excisionase family DNA binding protein